MLDPFQLRLRIGASDKAIGDEFDELPASPTEDFSPIQPLGFDRRRGKHLNSIALSESGDDKLADESIDCPLR